MIYFKSNILRADFKEIEHLWEGRKYQLTYLRLCLSAYLLLMSHFFMHCHVVFLTLCSSVTLSLTQVPATHTHTDPPTTTTTCFTLLHHHLFSSKWLKHSNCLPPPPPHLTVFYLSLFFFLLPCFSPFLLSVSIGGHGLGKPTERLQNVEELVQLSCLFCQHGVRWHQLSICYAILYPSLYFFFSCSSLCHTLFPLISSLTPTLITVCLCLLSIIGQTNGLTE